MSGPDAGFLKRTYGDPQLNLTLELFLRTIERALGNRFVSVILYGSIVFDDLAPGYGDLDFLAVVESDLSEPEEKLLIELRRPLRSGPFGVYATMLEGAFLPAAMLDPAVPGKALWWGTSGERSWSTNDMGPLVLHVIREMGQLIYGEDLRGRIPPVLRADMVSDVRRFLDSCRRHGKEGNLHTIDWLLTTSRLILWLKEGRLSSKSEAALWGGEHLRGEWKKHLARCRTLRLQPQLVQQRDFRIWLDGLSGAIEQACEELEEEMEKEKPFPGEDG
jgi:hypothetical protein